MYSNNSIDINTLIQQGYTVKFDKYLSRGWELLNHNIGSFLGFSGVVFLLNLAFLFVPTLGNIASFVLGAPLNAGFVLFTLKIAKGKSTTFSDFFRGFDYFIQVFLATLLMSIFTFAGIVLLLIPGIYLAVAYIFTIPLILDRKVQFWDAMEASRKIITKNWCSMFAFVFVLGSINIGGFLLLGVGMVLTTPFTGCAIIAAYEDIVGLRSSSDLIED